MTTARTDFMYALAHTKLPILPGHLIMNNL